MGAAALGWGYRERELITSAYKTVSVVAADLVYKQLTRTSPALLRQAAAVSDELLYSPAKDVKAALERGRVQARDIGAGALQTVAVGSDTVDKLLRYAPSKLPRTAQAAVKYQELPHEAANVEGVVKFTAEQTADRQLSRRLKAVGRVLRAARFVKQHPHPPKPQITGHSYLEA
jgi:hypothetical protein